MWPLAEQAGAAAPIPETGPAGRLRELTGREERALAGTTTVDALRLLDALLFSDGGTAEEMTAAERDRALADLYRQIYGDRIESVVDCAACGQPFALDFSLRELVAAGAERPGRRDFAVHDGAWFTAPQGWRFRVPNGRDERAAAAAPGDAVAVLFRRCSDPAAPPPDPEALQAALDEVAPLVELELRARCPECGRERILQFDIQTYLLGSLLGERDRLFAEIHRLASTYHWTLAEIQSLTRSDRRRMVALIENQNERQTLNP